MEIVRAGIDDLDLLVPLFEGYRAFYGGGTAPDRARAFLRERLELGESVILLARSGNEGVGFTQLYPLFSSVAMQPMLLLNDLFVAPSQRRTGLAKKLIEAAEAIAREHGVARMRLSTQHTNTAAQALYEKLGWELEAEFRSYNRAL